MFVLTIVTTVLIGLILLLLGGVAIMKNKSLSSSEVITYVLFGVTYILALICMWG